jgi:Ca-activated chloride channel family protein
MNRKSPDARSATRRTIEAKVNSRHRIESNGPTLVRLRITTQTGGQSNLLATPDSDLPHDVETDATYRFLNLFSAHPVSSSSNQTRECPHCGDHLRDGQFIDAAGSAVIDAIGTCNIDADERIFIFDSTSSLSRIDTSSDTSSVDDWQPMEDQHPVVAPEYVCPSCGRHVEALELRGRSAVDEPAKLSVLNDISNNFNDGTNMAASDTVALAAGGAKDVINFRENIANGYTPEPEAISDEGLFYDYYFETGSRTETESLFAPRYAAAVSDHPLSTETERYLSVGLDSRLSTDEFERPRLDLVAVLDISGSMSSQFDQYYYDEQGNKHEAASESETKLAAATQSLSALTEQLHPEDRLGIVLYDHRAHVAKPLRDVGATDMPAIRNHIREIESGGSTNMEDGFVAAIDMLADGTTDHAVERRVVFMTDMMPNMGETGTTALTSLFEDAATDGIHTTFIGMGLDANAELANTVSGIRGANHYFIHSADEFEQRLGEEFDYMVTPLVYDLDLQLKTTGYDVETVHGSPVADAAGERLMHIGTLFPSAKRDGEARGGVILVRLAESDPDGTLTLQASWTERDGSNQSEDVSVSLPDAGESFTHKGVRKAVALARYARELRAWARDVHDRAENATGVDDWLLPSQRGEHERESVPLVVPDEYASRFETLREYLAAEMQSVGDESINQEQSLLKTLCQSKNAQEPELNPSDTTDS